MFAMLCILKDAILCLCQVEMSSKERTQKYRERPNADHARREEVLKERRKEIMPVHTEQTPSIGIGI